MHGPVYPMAPVAVYRRRLTLRTTDGWHMGRGLTQWDHLAV